MRPGFTAVSDQTATECSLTLCCSAVCSADGVLLCTCRELDVLVVACSRRHGLAQGLVGPQGSAGGFGGRCGVGFGFGVLAWFGPHQTLCHLQGRSHLLGHLYQLCVTSGQGVKNTKVTILTVCFKVNVRISGIWSTSESNSMLLLLLLSRSTLTFLSIS